MDTVQRENKMGTMGINRLLLTVSLPMMISMLVQALYNIVDSIFVSQISENALTAVSLAFPIQNLMIAVGSGTGVGMNAFLSKSLGEKKFHQANLAAKNGLFLAAMSTIVFMLIGIFFSRPFFEMQTSDAEIVDFGVKYMSICCFVSIGCFGQMACERLLQSTGKTFYSMITQGTGAIINIIFDPIMIFGLFGFPALGISGAAIATVLGQCVAFVMALIFNVKLNKEISINMKGFRPNLRIIKHIYSVGIPSILMMAISSIMTFGLNKILLIFSSTATAVFGVYYKLQSFVFMPIFGLNNGMVPILAYNLGAQHKDRIEKTIKLAIIYAVIIMIAGFALFQIFPGWLMSLFESSPAMTAMGVVALRIISFNFIFAGFSVIISAVFQAFGKGIYSLIVSIARQLVVILPAAYLLSLLGNVDYVWLAFPISEVATFILTIILMKHTYNLVLKPMKREA